MESITLFVSAIRTREVKQGYDCRWIEYTFECGFERDHWIVGSECG